MTNQLGCPLAGQCLCRAMAARSIEAGFEPEAVKVFFLEGAEQAILLISGDDLLLNPFDFSDAILVEAPKENEMLLMLDDQVGDVGTIGLYDGLPMPVTNLAGWKKPSKHRKGSKGSRRHADEAVIHTRADGEGDQTPPPRRERDPKEGHQHKEDGSMPDLMHMTAHIAAAAMSGMTGIGAR